MKNTDLILKPLNESHNLSTLLFFRKSSLLRLQKWPGALKLQSLKMLLQLFQNLNHVLETYQWDLIKHMGIIYLLQLLSWPLMSITMVSQLL